MKGFNLRDVSARSADLGIFGVTVVLIFTGLFTVGTAPMIFAQEPGQVEIADAEAVSPQDTYRYKGMPLLRAPLSELQYPEKAREMGVEGRVIVKYTINENGKVTDSFVLRGIGYGCDEEALRIINEALFAPVVDKEGHPVQKTFITPVNFRIK